MRRYHAYTPDQAFLLPPSLVEAIDPDDPVHFLRHVLQELDLSAIHEDYRAERGRPPFHPQAMTGILLYGACLPVGRANAVGLLRCRQRAASARRGAPVACGRTEADRQCRSTAGGSSMRLARRPRETGLRLL